MDVNIVALLAVGVAAAAKLLWELYLSPLARQRIPGPKRAAVSDLWHYWVQVRLRRTFTFHELFEVRVYSERTAWMRYSLNDQRYGPVVRVGPNRVIFCNIDAVKTIYSTHRFRKSDWWSSLTFGGAQNMLSTVCGGLLLVIIPPDMLMNHPEIQPTTPIVAASVHLRFGEKTCVQRGMRSFKRWKNLSVAFAATAQTEASSMQSSYSQS